MKPTALQYAPLSKLIAPIVDRTGLAESASFLVWFLENVYRLEETDARDAVCDHANDKGIDGIYIDHNNEEIHFLQVKIRQSANGKVGDVGPKDLMASLAQFSTSAKIQTLLAGNADSELKQLITPIQLADMVTQIYSLIGVYVTNELSNTDSLAYEKLTPAIRIYDRDRIAALIVDVDSSGGKKGEFVFDTSYVEPMKMQVGAGKNTATMYVFPAKAMQLVHMEGIGDGSLSARTCATRSVTPRSISRSAAQWRRKRITGTSFSDTTVSSSSARLRRTTSHPTN